jgi:hypothetical protein
VVVQLLVLLLAQVPVPAAGLPLQQSAAGAWCRLLLAGAGASAGGTGDSPVLACVPRSGTRRASLAGRSVTCPTGAAPTALNHPFDRLNGIMADLGEAILMAVKAHYGQRDKGGAPYILHPLRLMFRQTTEAARIAAVLHDVVEDTPVTLEQLREAGFEEEVVQAVACLTHDPTDSYDEYIAKIQLNPIARVVKLADLEDNMRLERIANPTGKDWERLKRYHRFWKELSAVRR